jgi:predicted RNA-binding protein with TRAM domain
LTNTCMCKNLCVRDEFVARHRKRKHSWNTYTSEVQRFSIYTRVKSGIDNEVVRVGNIITLSIKEVDEKGRGIASYRGRRVIVYNASLGSTVKAKVVKTVGDTVYAEIIDTLRESDTEY